MIEIAIIQTAVAEAFGLHFDDLKQSSRVRATAFPRQIAIYLAKQQSN
jgi:chromosomal replication initiation ATPase DnaA